MHEIIATILGFLISSGSYSDDSHSVDLQEMAEILRGDVRLVVLGDSYCAPYFVRVPAAALSVWPINEISAIGGGAPTASHLVRCLPQCSPSSIIQASDNLGYMVERNSKNHFFALPIRSIQEIYTSDTFENNGNNRLFNFVFNPTGLQYLSVGVHGSFATNSDNLKFRFLYRCVSDTEEQLKEVAITDGDFNAGTIDLINGARPMLHLGENPGSNTRLAIASQINAAAFDYSVSDINSFSVGLEQTEDLVGTFKYFEPAGGVYYKAESTGLFTGGLYYNSLWDQSWSYSAFGCDSEANDYLDKRFSKEQFINWLDVTTLDVNQPTVFLWYFHPEQIYYNEAYDDISNMLDQTNSAAQSVGLSSFSHLIVISHMCNMQTSVEIGRAMLEAQRDAVFDIAASRSNVSAASIYDATDKIYFIGEDAKPWLAENGFNNFEYGISSIDLTDFSGGDLLDASNNHPKDFESAAFFAAVLGDIIREAGCLSDLHVDGYIDVHDLLLLLNGWGHGGDSDINADGTTDIHDLLLLVNEWGECWPVQSPFSQ